MSRLAAAVLVSGVLSSPVLAADATASSTVTREDGVAAFGTVWRVLTSPRCRNCHPDGDRPLQYDEGLPHAMDVGRKATELGLTCSACHVPEPLAGPHLPPGAPNWGLPPEESPMPFQGRTAPALCAQLKDPSQTHGKDLPGLLKHVSEDALVKWGWSPGEGRTTPPVSYDEFLTAFRTWVDAGGPCPSS